MTGMKDKEYYVWKAKTQRALTDEQIAYFLSRDERWELLPYYARFVRRLGMAGALNEVHQMFGS